MLREKFDEEMQRNLYKSLILVAALIMGLPMMSQVRRVKCYSNSKAAATYIDVYEYDYVDVRPQFPGGERGLVNFINQTREYPYDAYEAGVQGRVLCSFVVNVDGSVSNISVVRGCNHQLNREAVRVISEMPKWKAGKMGDKAVPVMCLLPIVFRL